MNYIKLNLIVTAVVLGGYGLRAVLDPAWAADSMGLIVESGEGSTSLRAVYGGWMVGVAVLLIASINNEQRARFGLLAILCIISPVFLARTYGLLIEDYFSVGQLGKLAMEATSVLVTSFLLLKTRAVQNPSF